MAIVVSLAERLPDKASRKHSVRQESVTAPEGGARILLFTGIRYERLPEPPKARRPRSGKSSADIL